MACEPSPSASSAMRAMPAVEFRRTSSTTASFTASMDSASGLSRCSTVSQRSSCRRYHHSTMRGQPASVAATSVTTLAMPTANTTLRLRFIAHIVSRSLAPRQGKPRRDTPAASPVRCGCAHVLSDANPRISTRTAPSDSARHTGLTVGLQRSCAATCFLSPAFSDSSSLSSLRI